MEEAFSPAGRNWYLWQRGRGLLCFCGLAGQHSGLNGRYHSIA